MLKKTLYTIIAALFTIVVYAQNWQTQSGVFTRPSGIWPTRMMKPPYDTMLNKSGIALLGGVLYVGDSTKWNIVGLGSGTETDPTVGVHIKAILTTDITNWNTAYSWGNHASAGYAIYPSQTGNAGKYLTTNGTSASWATITSASNIGNSNLRLTGNRILSGGATPLGYSFTFDSLQSLNATNPATGLDYFYVDQSGRLTLTGENGNNNLDIDRFGGFEWSSTNDVGGSPVRFSLNSEIDTATFEFKEKTKIKLQKVNPNNGSSYKILVQNDATKYVEYINGFSLDTLEIATRDYVNYKDDLQQTLIDFRKLDSDTSRWQGYTTRERTQQQFDSAGVAQAIINGVQNDTLNNHNTRILANQNAVNTLDALVVKIGGSQTITGDKVTTGLFTARANDIDSILDLSKGFVLENLTPSAITQQKRYSPRFIWKGQAFNAGAGGSGIANGNNEFMWGVELRASVDNANGGGASRTANNLVFSQKSGTNDWVDVVTFTRNGISAALDINTITLGRSGANGNIQLRRSSDGGGNGQVSASSSGGVSISGNDVILGSSSSIAFSGNPLFGMRYFNSTGLIITNTSSNNATPSSMLVVANGGASIGANVAAPTNGLIVSGRTRLTGLEAEIITRTSDYTVTETDHTILVDASSGNVTITLRTAVGSKQLYNIKRIDNSGNTVTVTTTSSQTIDGATTYTGLSAQYKYVQVQANGTAYFIISNN